MKTLNTLLEQAEAARNQALAAFNQARSRYEAACAQATQLDAYRADYQRRWSTQFARGAALEIVRCYQGFADRLETAIAQQGQAVNQAEAALQRAGDSLTAREMRVASVRKLIDRRAAALRQVADRHEQRADDEDAMRMASTRNKNASGIAGVPT